MSVLKLELMHNGIVPDIVIKKSTKLFPISILATKLFLNYSMCFPNKAIDGDAFLQEYKKVVSSHTSLVGLRSRNYTKGSL